MAMNKNKLTKDHYRRKLLENLRIATYEKGIDTLYALEEYKKGKYPWSSYTWRTVDLETRISNITNSISRELRFWATLEQEIQGSISNIVSVELKFYSKQDLKQATDLYIEQRVAQMIANDKARLIEVETVDEAFE